jgi:hypothetical protein
MADYEREHVQPCEYERQSERAVGMVRAFMREVGELEQGEAEKVWSLLTSLRGPDSRREKDKELGATEVRRRVMGKKLAIALGLASSYKFHVYPAGGRVRELSRRVERAARGWRGGEEHYWSHVCRAVEVLVGAWKAKRRKEGKNKGKKKG